MLNYALLGIPLKKKSPAKRSTHNSLWDTNIRQEDSPSPDSTFEKMPCEGEKLSLRQSSLVQTPQTQD
jgi:hypothetical protein